MFMGHLCFQGSSMQMYCYKIFHCILFICSLVDGYLICFQFLTWWIIVPWTVMHKCLRGHMFSFLLSIHLMTLKLLSHRVTLHWTPRGTARRFSTAAVHFAFPPAAGEGSNFSTFLTTLAGFCLFEDGRSCGYDMCLLVVWCAFSDG